MKQPKTHAEKVAYLKDWMANHKLTVTHDPVVPEWLCAEMLHMTPDKFVQIVLLDDCPLKPVYRAGARFYRLEDLAEHLEFPK
ncbi:MAG: hypothetical protein RQ732_10605 [Methylophaga sp.]|nr:hypothetical protein [Methylophaga sp.]